MGGQGFLYRVTVDKWRVWTREANAAEGKQQEAEFRAQRHAQQEKGRAEQQRRKADAKRRKAHDEDEFDGFG